MNLEVSNRAADETQHQNLAGKKGVKENRSTPLSGISVQDLAFRPETKTRRDRSERYHIPLLYASLIYYSDLCPSCQSFLVFMRFFLKKNAVRRNIDTGTRVTPVSRQRQFKKDRPRSLSCLYR